MSTRIIIVWAFAVVLLFGIGIFGYVNRDLFNTTDEEPEEAEKITTKTCDLILDKGKVTYKFQLEDKTIIKYSATYKTSVDDPEKFVIASNINNTIATGVEGITTVFYGSAVDFSLMINVETLGFEKSIIDPNVEELKELNMIISNNGNFESYKARIDAISLPFTCN